MSKLMVCGSAQLCDYRDRCYLSEDHNHHIGCDDTFCSIWSHRRPCVPVETRVVIDTALEPMEREFTLSEAEVHIDSLVKQVEVLKSRMVALEGMIDV